jgi:valyl-tRNA synthetase
MVNDEHNQKMSKSKGNVISPVELSQQYGTDAMRMSLVIGNGPGNNIPLSRQKVESYRNFTNKLWNIGRYVLQTRQPVVSSQQSVSQPECKSSADEWILARLNVTVSEVTKHLEAYNFSLAGETLRDFTWNEFADWYVEIHKIEKNDSVLRFVFETLLKLWHPFMPFVTEALFQSIYKEEGRLLMIEPWPNSKKDTIDDDRKNTFEHVIKLITAIRNVRSTYRIEPARKITATVITPDTAFLENQQAIVQKLARIETLNVIQENIAIKNAAHISVADMKVFVHLEGILDMNKEAARLTKELGELEQYLVRLEAKLGNETFVNQAPETVVTGVRDEYARAQQKLTQVREALDSLK